MTEMSLADKLEVTEKVGELYLQRHSTNAIGKELGLSSKQVKLFVEEWKGLMRRQAETASDVKDKVMDILFESEQHFDIIRKKTWETVEQADEAGQINSKINALKLAAAITKDMVHMFESSGINSDTALIEEINQRERNERILVDLLKDIRNEHPEIADSIARRLRQMGESVEKSVIEIESVERE